MLGLKLINVGRRSPGRVLSLHDVNMRKNRVTSRASHCVTLTSWHEMIFRITGPLWGIRPTMVEFLHKWPGIESFEADVRSLASCPINSWCISNLNRQYVIVTPLRDGVLSPLMYSQFTKLERFKMLMEVLTSTAMRITVRSYWAQWHRKSPTSPLFTQPFIRAQIKENIKAPHH